MGEDEEKEEEEEEEGGFNGLGFPVSEQNVQQVGHAGGLEPVVQVLRGARQRLQGLPGLRVLLQEAP